MPKNTNANKVVTAKQLPYNSANEAALLGCFLIDGEVCNDLVSGINANYFFIEAHKNIYDACFSLYKEGKPVDIVTVSDWLEKAGKLEQSGGMEYLYNITENIASSVGAKTYLDNIYRDYLTRRVIRCGVDISEYGYRSESGEAALRNAERCVFDISESLDKSDLEQISTVSNLAYDRIERIQKGHLDDKGLSTGFDNVDELIGGLRPGTFNLIAARPGVGKTAFALSVATHLGVGEGKHIAIFNLEMSKQELVGRMLTQLSGIPKKYQETPRALAPSQIKKLYEVNVALGNSEIYIDVSVENTPASILSKCRRMKVQHGLDLVIIDYLQLMSSENAADRREGRQQEVSDMSRNIKKYAKELEVPFLVLSQLNRAGEVRGGEPKLSDLRESGSIEQDADFVAFLQRYNPAEQNGENVPAAKAVQSVYSVPNVVEMYVKKNRHGELGKLAFEWQGHLQRFVPIEVPDSDNYKPVLKQSEKEDKPPKATDETPKMPEKVATLQKPQISADISADAEIVLKPVVDDAPFDVAEDAAADVPFPTDSDFSEETFDTFDEASFGSVFDDENLKPVTDDGDIEF